MPAEQETQTPRRNTGMIVLGSAIVVAVVLGLFTNGFGLGFLSHKLTVTTYFKESAGLKSGAAVNLDGVAIGTVKSVTITNAPERKKTPVQVVMKLSRKYQSSLHTDSLATLTSLGALADTSVDIDSQTATGPPLRDGDELKTLTPRVLDLKAGQAIVRGMNALEGRFNTVVDQMEAGKGTIGQFITNPSLQNNVSATAKKVRDVSGKLDNSSNSLGKLINDHSITDRLAGIAKNTQSLQDSFGKLTSGPLQTNLTATQAHASSLMAEVNAGKGGAGMLMNNPTVTAQMKDTAAKANSLASNYSNNPGTGGNFAAGGAITFNLAKLQAESAAVAAMIRKDPKKYLTIQVRVF